MSNNLTGNPLVIDTANSSVPIVQGQRRIYSIEWHNYANNTSHCVVTDSVNRELFNSHGRDDLVPIKGGAEGWVNGIIVPTLDSGILMIYER